MLNHHTRRLAAVFVFFLSARSGAATLAAEVGQGLASAASVAAPLLEYSYGNHITHSELFINQDGEATTREFYCGGCEPQEISGPLRGDVLAALIANIAAAETEPQIAAAGGPTLLGSSSGTVRGYTTDGVAVNIRTITRADQVGPDAFDQVTYSAGPGGAAALLLANSLVQVPMPSDEPTPHRIPSR